MSASASSSRKARSSAWSPTSGRVMAEVAVPEKDASLVRQGPEGRAQAEPLSDAALSRSRSPGRARTSATTARTASSSPKCGSTTPRGFSRPACRARRRSRRSPSRWSPRSSASPSAGSGTRSGPSFLERRPGAPPQARLAAAAPKRPPRRSPPSTVLPDERPALRKDISILRQAQLGEVMWIVKNPATSKYYQFSEPMWQIIRLFDGTRTRQEILDEINRHSSHKIGLKLVLEYEEFLRSRELIQLTAAERASRCWISSRASGRRRWRRSRKASTSSSSCSTSSTRTGS